MKKTIFILIFILVQLLCVSYANPISIEGAEYGIIATKFGYQGIFATRVILVAIMLIIMLLLIWKSLDVKNKPEKKKSFYVSAVILVLIALVSLASSYKPGKTEYDNIYQPIFFD